MGFVVAAVGGAVVGFGIARSLWYERWVRDRRDRAAIAQARRINQHFTQPRRVHPHGERTEGVAGRTGPAAR